MLITLLNRLPNQRKNPFAMIAAAAFEIISILLFVVGLLLETTVNKRGRYMNNLPLF